jgi:hypothetical protein
METPTPVALATAVDKLVYLSHQNAVLHGFYDTTEDNHVGIKLMLVVTELSEMFEAFRRDKNISPDEHCPPFTNEEVEIADAIIRLYDYSGWRNLRLGPALIAKMEYNKSRPYKHEKNL